MKPLKLTLRFWILISSIFSFVFGWSMFSHAGKPTPFSIFTSPNTDTTVSDTSGTDAQSLPSYSTVPTLAPIPSLDSLLTSPTTGAGTALDTGAFNVQKVQVPPAAANNNIFSQVPARRLRTKKS